MREILGRRRFIRAWEQLSGRRLWGTSRRYPHRSSLRSAALLCATQWRWPVVPGAPALGKVSGKAAVAGCSCPDPDCAVPGAHPFEPVLLAASTDETMVRWWWTKRPGAPLVLATGGRAPCAVSLPAVAGARALATFDRTGVRLGPVVATPTRFSFLVAPYDLPELGELLYAQDWVPSSLRFHGGGGYIALPPSQTGAGKVRWERQPGDESGPPWLPRVESLLDVLIEESAATPDSGSKLTY
ncbi:bifunctional DNA primase/polymerase [Streptomyces boncukensis]|uniref:Bifunctional DNA primase/polymerase n=1 Tax=Streptomyces boncukensis TaxID=2711219 RepID=A0A6G4WQL1_9ACTN|nr:bifunctional DNA primase/polymerase [Streptomyces boncukensis]NGO67559.1 bifunctional DNA primase/polymerase [Streptomyces boncukensis]